MNPLLESFFSSEYNSLAGSQLPLSLRQPMNTPKQTKNLPHRLGHCPRRQTKHSSPRRSLGILFPTEATPAEPQPLPRPAVPTREP
jgi:hypothetical protein